MVALQGATPTRGEVMSTRSRSSRIGAAVVVVFFAMAVLAPSAGAFRFEEFWQGTWSYVSGDPGTMKLKQDGKDVHGKYFTESGVKAGSIEGTVSKQGRYWSGTYRNTNDADQGTFYAKLKGDDVSFKGEFTSADGMTYDWHGDKR